MENGMQERIADNESVFREVNESIVRGQWPGEEDSAVSFRCECARLGCNALIELTLREYESVRANSRWFVIAPGHEIDGAETVVRTEPGYVVVEKSEEAGRLAEATDPRG